jgi:hypothetical protein
MQIEAGGLTYGIHFWQGVVPHGHRKTRQKTLARVHLGPCQMVTPSTGRQVCRVEGPNSDTSPVTGAITYDVYVASGVQTAPTIRPKLTGITTTAAAPWTGMAAGQYTAWVSAAETPTPGGSSSESVVSVATPFVLVVPNPPANVNVRQSS